MTYTSTCTLPATLPSSSKKEASVRLEPGVAILHPGIKSATHRGIHLYAQSLIAGLKQAGFHTALVTEAPVCAQGSALAILQDMVSGHASKTSSLAALPQYLKHRILPSADQAKAYPCNKLPLGEQNRYLAQIDDFLNHASVYEMARLASNKPGFSPVSLDMISPEDYKVAFTSEPLAVRPGQRGPKLVQTIHDLIVLNSKLHDLSPQKFLRRLQACVQHADMIISVSEHTRADIIDRYPSVEDRIRVIYQPLPADEKIVALSKNSSAQQAVLDKFKLRSGNFIFYIGAIEQRKNVARLVRAHQRSQHAKDIPLIMAGPLDEEYVQGENMSIFFDPASKEEGIRYIGRISEMEKLCLLRNAAFFAFPTITEGFGLPLLEAQSMGCPVVTSNAGAIPEVVGHTAMLINDPLDEEEISAALDTMACMDTLERTALRQAGEVNVQRFHRDLFARQLQQLVTEL